MRALTQIAAVLTVLCAPPLISGCSTYAHMRSEPRPAGGDIVKPVVAVIDFDNRSDFKGQWNLGDGMAEMYVSELIDTERFTVLERRHLGDLLDELVLQGQKLFRKEGQVEKGRLKNAQYLVHGAVTDFTVTGDASGWFSASGGKAFLGGSKAKVSMVVNVSDIETGEIVVSTKSSGSASKRFFGGGVNYKDVSFGGEAYFRTPLGKATRKAMEKSIRQVMAELPAQTWRALVAEADIDTVVINGGQRAGLRVGDIFLVRKQGRNVTDPITGDVIDVLPGPVTGKVEVRIVKPSAAHGIVLEGEARRGDMLERVSP